MKRTVIDRIRQYAGKNRKQILVTPYWTTKETIEIADYLVQLESSAQGGEVEPVGFCTEKHLALFPGWSKSKEAQLEYGIAHSLGMKIVYLPGAEKPAPTQGEVRAFGNGDKVVEALKDLLAIVRIHSHATGNNFAWAEVQYAEDVLAKAAPTQGVPTRPMIEAGRCVPNRPGQSESDWIKEIYLAMQDAAPNQPNGGWVRCEDRLPTENDADFEHRLWCWFPERGDMKALLLDQVLQAHMSGLPVQWTPTGLKRPQPPKNKQEGDGNE